MKLRIKVATSGILTAFIGAFFTSFANALPLEASIGSTADMASPVERDFGDVDFTSIVALSNCSGSLVRFKTSLDSDNAVILTNGHCLEDRIPNPGEAIVDRGSTRSFQLLSSDATSTIATLTASRIIYATMTGTDITLYRLQNSYADILSRWSSANDDQGIDAAPELSDDFAICSFAPRSSCWSDRRFMPVIAHI